MTRPNEIRLGPPDLSRSSNLHGSLLEGYAANGTGVTTGEPLGNPGWERWDGGKMR